jgi:hypothetical protein
MLRTLQSAGVIDEQLEWAAGDTHLVIVGDMLDRGADSRKVMDMVMALEQQAPARGGTVHVLLGNHEVMNLVGDLRYVAHGEYAAFADDEDANERRRWFEHFRAANPEVTDDAALQAAFDRQAPPGFFAHRRAFRPDGYYGKWLLEKPLLLVIDGTAFVHGGLSPIIADLGLDGVNTQLRHELHAYTVAVTALADAGLLSPIENFYDHAERVQSLPGAPEPTVSTIIELSASAIHGSQGPLWYRGNVGCGPLIESDKLERSLAAIGARRVVIGHTPTLTRRILQRLEGRVIEIDTGMLTAAYKGSGNALLIAGETLSVFNESGSQSDGPVPHPRRVGLRDDALGADAIGNILASAEIRGTSVDEAGRTVVTLAAGDGALHAVFNRNPGKGFVPEVAAYRLDRLLSLDMVPVSAVREVDGDKGSLQFLPARVSDEAQRSTSRRGGDAWCPLPEQWNAMYVFDALIYNPGRPPQAINYSEDIWQLMLTSHQLSFDTKRGLPPWLQAVELQIGDAWVRSLQSLDDATLQKELGDVLDKRRLTALAARRDELLKL